MIESLLRRASTMRASVIALVTFVLHAPSLVRPIMDVDEGSYAAIACRMLQGGLPYRDGVENKFPGIYYVYEATFALFGRYDMAALHLMVTLAALGTALACGAIARELCRTGSDNEGDGARTWWIAALGYAVYSTTYYPKMLAGNTEMFLVLPSALAVLAYARARGRARWLVAAGVCAGLALLLKQVAGFTVAVLLGQIAVEALQTRRLGRGLGAAALVLVGFAAPLGAVVAYFAHRGILADARFWTWTYVLHYYIPSGTAGQGFWLNALEYLVPFLLLVSPLVVLALRARPLARHSLAWIWFAGGFCAALVGGRMYGHYFLMMMPGLATLAGIGGAALFRPTAAPSLWRRFFYLATPLTVVGTLVAAIVYEPATESLWSPKPDYRVVSDYVRQQTRPDERVFVWGWFPPLYVRADRCPSTRFVYTHVLAGRAEGAGARGHRVDLGWQMLLDDLTRDPPRYILDTSVGRYDFDYAPMTRYPALWSFVQAHYRRDRVVGGVQLWQLER